MWCSTSNFVWSSCVSSSQMLSIIINFVFPVHHHEFCYISSSLIINIVNLFFPHFVFSTHQHQVCIPISSSLSLHHMMNFVPIFPLLLSLPSSTMLFDFIFSLCTIMKFVFYFPSSLLAIIRFFSVLSSLLIRINFLFHFIFFPCHHQLLFQFHLSFFPAIINFVPISSFLLSPPSSTLQCFSNIHFLS